MTAHSSMRQHVRHALPLLTIGLAVLGLLLTSRVVWWSTAPEPREEMLRRLPTQDRPRPLPPSPWTPKFVGGAVVTVPVLLCALYVIASPTYGDADKKWAYGAVGTLLGF